MHPGPGQRRPKTLSAPSLSSMRMPLVPRPGGWRSPGSGGRRRALSGPRSGRWPRLRWRPGMRPPWVRGGGSRQASQVEGSSKIHIPHRSNRCLSSPTPLPPQPLLPTFALRTGRLHPGIHPDCIHLPGWCELSKLCPPLTECAPSPPLMPTHRGCTHPGIHRPGLPSGEASGSAGGEQAA